ncbi:hypothetical protein J2Y67_004053 [Neobacillus niacini]|nr:hypothetical protein [Neobacillus niacini]
MANYKTELHEAITQLQQATRRGEMPREVRLGRIDGLIEDYFAKTGEMPDAVTLERLADLILHEELTDNNEHKISHTEYPFLSERQFDRRDSREVKSANGMDGNAADGQKHGRPTRRERSDYENRFVDKKARIRNKDRKKTYHDFTKVQPVIVRKMGN